MSVSKSVCNCAFEFENDLNAIKYAAAAIHCVANHLIERSETQAGEGLNFLADAIEDLSQAVLNKMFEDRRDARRCAESRQADLPCQNQKQ